MKVQEAMTGNAEYIPTTMPIGEAAKRMRDLDCGFLPLGDSPDGKLQGVVTDRDLAIRCLAEGRDPQAETVGSIKSDQVLYCYQNDELEDAARSMRENQVYRLVVLNNADDKKLCGVISLGDITRSRGGEMSARAAEGISAN